MVSVNLRNVKEKMPGMTRKQQAQRAVNLLTRVNPSFEYYFVERLGGNYYIKKKRKQRCKDCGGIN